MATEQQPPHLETVYNGAKDKTTIEGAVDIVAVHGLGAHPKRTWVAQNENGTDVHWLRDLLPRKIPQARIMCFNYDSRCLGNGLAEQTLPEIAKQLLDCLHHEDKQRPIIFIGHSFGGVIIEQALVLANSDGGKCQYLTRSTEGVVFLGTPFRSSKLQTWGEIVANCVKVVGTSEGGLLKHLELESEKLDDLLDEFTRIAVQMWARSVFCFYELHETTVVAGTQAMLVVDKTSGTIPGFTHIPIQTDHCKLNKFRSRDDPNFIIISNNIAKLAATGRIKTTILSGDQRKCLQALLNNPVSDRDYIIENKGKRVEGTCEWILSNKNYMSWIQGSGSQLLWLSGGPGKGKTFTSILLTEELEKTAQEQNATLSYFFCDNKVDKRNTAVSILRGLMHQLLSKRPDLFKHILPSFKGQDSQLFTSHSYFRGLWRIFEEMVQNPDSGMIYCVIDGLDECEPESLEVLVQYLKRMFSAATTGGSHGCFKLLVVSRDTPACIPSGFSTFSRVDLDSSSLEGKVTKNLDIFLSHKTTKLFEQKKYPLALQNDALKALKEGANGSFLWVSLVCNELEKKEISEVWDALADLPRGLDEIYCRILRQVDQSRRQIVTSILNWVTMATRPLTLLELGAATNVSPTDSLTTEEVTKEGVGYCGMLLQIDAQNRVSLVHQSAKDYLLQLSTKPTTDPDIHVHEQSASLELTRRCFGYVQDAFADGVSCPEPDGPPLEEETNMARIKKFPLLEYAALNWYEHLRALNSIEGAIDLSAPFFARDSSIYNAWLSLLPNAYYLQPKRGSPVLHFASFYGLTLLVERILFQEFRASSRIVFNFKILRTEISRRSRNGYTALELAVKNGYVEIVRLLVENGAKINHKGKDRDTALLQAAYKGHTDIAKLLVEKGAKINDKDKDGNTALLKAAQKGYTDIARLLVERGAETNDKNTGGNTALLEAAYRGYVDIVKLLVEKGAGLNHKNKYGDTALLKAAYKGHTDIAKLLVEKGAGLNHKDKCGNTALLKAARKGHTGTAKLLVEKGAEIDDKDKDGSTALIEAAYGGHTDIIKLLVEKGAEINHNEKYGNTALLRAACNGHIDIVKLLVEKSAEINYKDKFGDIALHKAVFSGHTDIVKLLVEKSSEINHKNKLFKMTPLVLAAYRGYMDIVKLLVEKGAEINDNTGDNTALLWATYRGYVDIAKLLVEKGADVNGKGIFGTTTLLKAAFWGRTEIAKLLVEKGAEINYKDTNENTALLFAATKGYTEIVKLLLEKGAEIDHEDQLGNTPLFQAVYEGHADTAKLLVEKGADVNWRNICKQNALHYELYGCRFYRRFPSTDMVNLLRDNGVDVDLRDSRGKTALDIAVREGYKECIKLLDPTRV